MTKIADRLTSAPFFAAVAIAATVAAFALGGWQGGVGMAVGIVGTSFNLWALWRVCALLGAVAEDQPQPKFGSVVTVFVFLLKLPVLIGLGLAMQRVGGPAMTCFLIGLGMVYFALVGWALARR